MPTFISEQARQDYLALQDTMRRAEFRNDRPVLDWCERYLVPRHPRLIEEP